GDVLAFAAALVIAATLAAGLAPARQSTRVNVADVLRRAGRGASSFRIGRLCGWLVGGEIALSCALLVVTGLMVSGVLGAVGRHPALGADRVVTARVDLSAPTYDGPGARARYLRSLVDRIAARPGVSAVSMASSLPGFTAPQEALEIEGRAVDRAAR